MKQSDASRAHALASALETLDAEWWKKELASEKFAGSWEYRGLRIGLADLGFGLGGDFDCCNVHGWADVDIVTGRKIVDAARSIIVAELRALGVDAT